MANQSNASRSISTLVAVEQYMSIYGPLILTTLGIIGNILSILIFLSPRYRRQSSHFYLLSLAISDLCFLCINLIEDTFRNHNELYQSRINILDHSSSIICIFIQYARNTTRLLSSWIIVSFTIERLLVVYHPLKRAIICRRKIARFVVFFLFLMSFLININVPFHYGIINLTNNFGKEDTICDILPKYRSIYMRFAISTMITVYLVPMCIIGFVNMLICSKLWRKSLLTEKDNNDHLCEQRQKIKHSRRSMNILELFSCLHRSKSTSNVMKPIEQFERPRISSLSQSQSIGSLITTKANTTQINNYLSTERIQNHTKSNSFLNSSANYTPGSKPSPTCVKTYIQSRANRVTVTLLLVSCSFLLLNSPYCAVWIANYIHGFRNATLKSIKEITELFMLTNFCINFLLYCVSGEVFRGELMYILQCHWKELYNRNDGEHRGSYKYRPNDEIQLKESTTKHRPTKYVIKNLNYYPYKS
ncbi:unnamed protein product [Rotaria magnacalcarata]|uniref:G-protein coupled receptors family 1 profile domain-containing protein n=1 Tax=Rotaria magnacalcarata TaxID=392030 RepID=A0A816LUI5_9BILA|nr:unnamed protein product [Rotaria magnacalcarata]CAF1241108.1 unnamed protein product [Rotaria magnacalcarata]CAF1902890.1 unnamed protein product [Rotaria magnacalcarata]CAF1939587.1 unnamed protein product [Rotaria magnacalcarata]CAF1941897.1 unnamed protein product [Rotaria magnacalcarata]